MFHGPPRPLPGDLPLSQVLEHVIPGHTTGAWVRGCSRAVRLYRIHPFSIEQRLIASSDLGFLLTCCERVLIRERQQLVAVTADTLIQWRSIQVSTGTPYLPGLDRLLELFPGRANSDGVLVPLASLSPEAVLAGCVAEGIPVVRSRIVYWR